MYGKRCKQCIFSLIKPFVHYFLLAWSSPVSFSEGSCICSRGWSNDKTSLLLAWVVYWSQTFLVQNVKACQSPVPHSAGTSRGEQQLRAHIRQKASLRIQSKGLLYSYCYHLSSQVAKSSWVQENTKPPQCRAACSLHSLRRTTKQTFQLQKNPTLPELFLWTKPWTNMRTKLSCSFQRPFFFFFFIKARTLLFVYEPQQSCHLTAAWAS